MDRVDQVVRAMDRATLECAFLDMLDMVYRDPDTGAWDANAAWSVSTRATTGCVWWLTLADVASQLPENVHNAITAETDGPLCGNPDCAGYLHVVDDHGPCVTACDECGLFEDDDQARQAHDRELRVCFQPAHPQAQQPPRIRRSSCGCSTPMAMSERSHFEGGKHELSTRITVRKAAARDQRYR